MIREGGMPTRGGGSEEDREYRSPPGRESHNKKKGARPKLGGGGDGRSFIPWLCAGKEVGKRREEKFHHHTEIYWGGETYGDSAQSLVGRKGREGGTKRFDDEKKRKRVQSSGRSPCRGGAENS